jgi:hypothetical protein
VTVLVDAPPALGVHDWTADEYHRDPLRPWGGSVSSTTLRHILWEDGGSPAQVRHERLHPEHKDAYDFGSVAHRMILGKGEEIRVVDAGDWKTKAAQQARKDAREQGAVPVLRKDFARARRLMHAVLRHWDAGPLFHPGRGVPERSTLWVDDQTGRYCRAMLDRYPNPDWPGRPIAVDLKTTVSVQTRALVRTVVKYGYDQQAAHYLDGLAKDGLVDAGFVFVFAESKPPHLVRVVQLAEHWVERGRRRNREALDLLDRCLDLDDWPGAPPGLLTLDPPGWLDTDRPDDIDL